VTAFGLNMDENILVINAGSSSVKFTLFEMETDTVAAHGVIERIGLGGTRLLYENFKGKKIKRGVSVITTGEAIGLMTSVVTDENDGVIRSGAEMSAIGHRVVHGGEKISAPVIVDEQVKHIIRQCYDLAPLHNPHNLNGIESCEKHFPGLVQVAVFDTAFHTTLPEHAYLYGLPYRLYREDGIRRYGFHGTSHQYVSRQAARLLKRPLAELKIITCHLGNGSSITAVDGGKSVDTSMGFTPLEGLIMGTRCGDIDPAICHYLKSRKGLDPDQIYDLLNHQSGIFGLAGIGSSDFRDILGAGQRGNRRAANAISVYAYRVKKYIGAYIAAMGGIDALVFTAGIGENSPVIREMICNGLQEINGLGIILDPEKNAAEIHGTFEIHGDRSRVKIFVIPTDEEKEIARQTRDVLRTHSPT